MDNRELKLFLHLADTLHFGRTSRACNITPSALTRTIQRLESEVDEKLFSRDNRSVELTPAGEAFKRYAEDVLQRWGELQRSLSSDAVLRGAISLYCSVTAVYSFLPRILGRFRTLYPQIHINLQTGDAARALTKLQDAEVDVTIDALPAQQPAGLQFLPLVETPLVFIAPVRFPETIVMAGDQIDWQKTPIIMAEQGLSRERIDRWFANKKTVPNIYAQVAGNEAIIAMVSLGCGVGVVPELVLEKSPLNKQVAVLPVIPELTPYTIGLCTVKKNIYNPLVKAFWDIAAQEGALSSPV